MVKQINTAVGARDRYKILECVGSKEQFSFNAFNDAFNIEQIQKIT